MKRLVVGSMIVVLCVFFFLPSLQAQDFPTKPITVVVPKEPGGAHDITARGMANVAKKYLGQSMLVEIKPGGGGAIGADFVAKSSADGYTILFGDSGVNSGKPAQSGRSKGPDDMVAICIINYSISPILVRSDAPYKTFKEFMDYAGKHPNELKYAAAGAGSWNEMAWKQVEAETGIKTRIIPYEGGAAGMLAVLGSHADITATGISSAAAYIKAGKLKPILILKDARVKSLPDVPTGKELGIKVNGTFWKGMVAPKGTPKPVIDKLALAFKKMSEDPAVVQLIERAGDELDYVGPDEFTKIWRAEYENQKRLYKSPK